MEYLMPTTLPFLLTITQEEDIIAYLQYGVHVMAIDNGADTELAGHVADELVDYQTRPWVQTRVRFIAEQILGIQGNGTGYRPA